MRGPVLVLFVICTASHSALAAVEPSYRGADEVLKALGAKAVTGAEPDLAAELETFRKTGHTGPPRVVAERFTDLVTRVLAMSDVTRINAMTRGAPANLRQVFAELPPPPVWPALRDLWRARAARSDHVLQDELLAVIGAALVGDRAVVSRDGPAVLKRMEAQSQRGASGYAAGLRKALDISASLTSAERIERILKSPPAHAWEATQLPDVVQEIGMAKAEPLLMRVLRLPKLEVSAPRASATLELARKLALDHIDTLPNAQWALGAWPVSSLYYEAMERRFVRPGSAIGPTRTDTPPAASDTSDDMTGQLDVAQRAYIVALLTEKRDDAAAALRRKLEIDRGSFCDDLLNDATAAGVMERLAELLEREVQHGVPPPGLWRLYSATSIRAGQATRAAKRVRAASEAAPPAERIVLQAELLRLLLASDALNEARALVRLVLSDKKPDPASREIRARLALDAARLALAVKEPAAVELALLATRDQCAFALYEGTCGDVLRLTVKSLLETDRGREAEALLIATLKGLPPGPAAMGDGGHRFAEPVIALLVEVYARAGRDADVIHLVEGFDGWSAADVADLLAFGNHGDSHDAEAPPHVAVRLASALDAAGQREPARRILRAVIEERDDDAAYAALARSEGDALIPWLDARLAADRFEERPLIWKAQLLGEAGDLRGAEAAARAAIALDPSDGEQGRGNRMRAYQVLGEILGRDGRVDEARRIENAIASIRAAEDADRLRRAGLTARAIVAYQKATALFEPAYCIHSRLAVELEHAGRWPEAQRHYERAFELMPDSFGPVESHCFGCEGVFDSDGAQSIAARVLGRVRAAHPQDARVHYLAGYLAEKQGRASDAIAGFREAVRLDPTYFNAWKHLLEGAEDGGLSAEEREHATLAAIRLDPGGKRRVCSDLAVRDLRALWDAGAPPAPPPLDQLFPLPATRAALERSSGRITSDTVPARMRHRYAADCSTPAGLVQLQDVMTALLGALEATMW